VIYLTGHTDPQVELYRELPRLGLIVQPGSYSSKAVARWTPWAADNGCYGLRGAPFDRDKWLRWLETLMPWASSCLFATAPDVLRWEGDVCRGDAWDTLAQAETYLPLLREMGFPAGLVLQDGMVAEIVPWGELDAVFIGGSDEFKLGPQVPRMVKEAKRRGLHAHMGRVNSRRRLLLAAAMGCDSADGTCLAYGSTHTLPKLLSWLSHLDAREARQWRGRSLI
jgi:hypothetical protein